MTVLATKQIFRLLPGVLVALLVSVPAGAEESLASVSSASGALLVRAGPAEPAIINQMHSWLLQIESPTGAPITDASVSISGGMPDHDHGLPTAPRMTRNLGNGDYLIEGMKFHMSGRWQITLVITTSQGQDSAIIELEL